MCVNVGSLGLDAAAVPGLREAPPGGGGPAAEAQPGGGGHLRPGRPHPLRQQQRPEVRRGLGG